MIAIGCLVVFGIYSASCPKLVQRELNTTLEYASSSGIDESTITWDGVQTKIEDFEKDLQPAEAEMEELWGIK